MTRDCGPALQAAIFGIIAGSPGCGCAVYDRVDPAAATPYVRIGDDTVADDGHKTNTGQDVTFILHTFTGGKTAGSGSVPRGRMAARRIMAAIYDLLHQQPIAIAGFNVADCRCEFSTTVMEEDDLVCHGIQRFRLSVEPV